MIIESSLVNPEFHDPAVYLFFPETGEAFLIDCGYIFPLRARDIQRISTVLISHFHIDHAIGLDHILRVCLGMQEKRMDIYGPAGTIRRMEGKLQGYLWNLCTDFSLDFKVHEAQDNMLRWALFTGRSGFMLADEGEAPMEDGVILERRDLRVRIAELEHKNPVLAFAVEGAPQVNIDKQALAGMGLSPGPWLKTLKESDPLPDEITVDGRVFKAGELKARLVKVTPGRKIAYVTDTIFNKGTAKSAIRLVEGADELYCEAPYLASERELAREYFHLTTRQAATIAKEGKVGKLHLFHISRRYEGNPEGHFNEAADIFPSVERARRYSDGQG
jgi:ribonuclease Z